AELTACRSTPNRRLIEPAGRAACEPGALVRAAVARTAINAGAKARFREIVEGVTAAERAYYAARFKQYYSGNHYRRAIGPAFRQTSAPSFANEAPGHTSTARRFCLWRSFCLWRKRHADYDFADRSRYADWRTSSARANHWNA